MEIPKTSSAVIIHQDMTVDFIVPKQENPDGIADDNMVLAAALALRIAKEDGFADECLRWLDDKAQKAGLRPVEGGTA